MKHLSLSAFVLLCALLVGFLAPALTRADQTAASGEPSLYKRLGGYDGVAALADTLIGHLASDQKLTKFFVGLSDNSKARLRQHFVELLCNASGGPCLYVGRDMKTVHKGLNITQADWDAMQGDVTATEDKFALKQRERDDIAALLTKLKPDIVTAK